MSFGGSIEAAGSVNANGYATKAGVSGDYVAQVFNVNWTGAAGLYIGSSFMGNFAFATSDRRLKHEITYLDTPADGDADIQKVLAGRPATWRYRDVEIWVDDGQSRRSFLSDDMQDIDPLLAPGDREGVNEEGGITPLNLNSDAMVSFLWGALRREIQLRQELAARIEALEARAH